MAPDPLVAIIEKALYGYVKPFQTVHVARKVVRVIAASEHREAVLRELRAAWGDDLGGALLHKGWTDYPHIDGDALYRWAEPPRQPAPSTESEK